MQRWTHKFFLSVRKPQIRYFLGSFRNRKSANFWNVSVIKSQIRKLLHLRKVRKSKNIICGFAICGTYLRTAHLRLYVLYCNVNCTLKINFWFYSTVPYLETGAKELHTFHNSIWFHVITRNALFIRLGKILKGESQNFPTSIFFYKRVPSQTPVVKWQFQVIYYKKLNPLNPFVSTKYYSVTALQLYDMSYMT
jgi:hypothetical protein